MKKYELIYVYKPFINIQRKRDIVHTCTSTLLLEIPYRCVSPWSYTDLECVSWNTCNETILWFVLIKSLYLQSATKYLWPGDLDFVY